MPRFRLILPLLAAISVSSCDSGKPQRAPALSTAWAGPVSLNLHRDIDPKSPTVATVPHGDKLEIVGQRRRSWYRVRTPQGVEGWTSNQGLLDSGQMSRLKALALETAGMPSQGAGATFGTLNVHSEPNRLSASFTQLGEHEKFDVVAHRVAARIPPPRRELIPEKPKVVKKAGKKGEKPSSIPLPPAPPEPAPPSDWVTLAGGHEPEPESSPDGKPVKFDDWSLIRTAGGQSGWVLTSAIYLQIPDEVAQYAEGHRITSYFSLGKTSDGGQQKDIWLWTTSSGLGEDHDFDGYRVFTWSLRHHRYETAFIQRRERGFFPVIAKPGEFSVCLEQPTGERILKHFTLNGNLVHFAGQEPCRKVEAAEEPEQQLSVAQGAPAVSFTGKLKARVTALFQRKQ